MIRGVFADTVERGRCALMPGAEVDKGHRALCRRAEFTPELPILTEQGMAHCSRLEPTLQSGKGTVHAASWGFSSVMDGLWKEAFCGVCV